ncbi:MAG TPA: hypothetical protein VMF12_08980 [Xanthobacteraceae bacterium]|nr:hypothetical protein [Xanthobacteraceae bacterium]
MTNIKYLIYALLALGFAGLIGAHEWGGDPSETVVPLVLAGAGTLSFVAAGLLARKLMKGGTPR